MTVYHLSEHLLFPDPMESEPEGLLAIGGDLRPERLVLAYSMGIFPWYSEGQPLLWWSPDPRLVLLPERVHLSKTLKRRIKKGDFSIGFDERFEEVIEHCAAAYRPDQEGTWISPEMRLAYKALHKRGLAHSVEIYYEGELAGGLYGVSLGSAFFGESMFSLQPDASKLALVGLSRLMEAWGFSYIDCQMPTDHLISMGAEVMDKAEFLGLLDQSNLQETRQGSWQGAEGAFSFL